MKNQIKIAITGPESTGKTKLSEQLAQHYNAQLVVEFAREYLINKGDEYTYEDIIYISKQQIEAEKKAFNSGAEIIICDTDTINIKIWLEYYNLKVPEFILNHIQSKPYDLSLLLYPNTNWEADGLRKNENDRIELYSNFKTNLINYNYRYKVVNGLKEKRLLQAIETINNLK